MRNDETVAVQLSGPRAVVTGGGAGIGLALVKRLVVEGADVVAVDVDPGAERAVSGAGARLVVADVASPEDWQRVVADAADRLGGLDLLVLNAAVPLLDPDPIGAPYGRVQRALAVNVEGVVHGVRTATPLMASGGGGQIVIVASLAGLMAYPDDPYYAMTKHAVVGFGRSSARALAKLGIRVVIFCPGVVDTAIVPAHVRSAVSSAGLEPLDPADAAGHLLGALAAEGTGRVWLSQFQLGLVEYEPAHVPLPRPVVLKSDT